MKIAKNLIGQKFGRLTVTRRVGEKVYKLQTKPLWECLCECGVKTTVVSQSLVLGTSQSCGCLMRDQAKHRFTKHGQKVGGWETPEYRAYCAARNRCMNQNDAVFPNYGGRGIQFLFTSFQEFFACVGKRPSKKYSLDRYPNNDGNYEIGNVRWATKTQQNRNRRKPRRRLEQFSAQELVNELNLRGVQTIPFFR